MNDAFHGAFESKLVSYMSNNYAGDDYGVRWKPNMCFWGFGASDFFKKSVFWGGGGRALDTFRFSKIKNKPLAE